MKSLTLIVTLLFIAPNVEAGSVRPVRGIDVIVQKDPSNPALRTVTSDADGAFTVSGLEAGSYILSFSPCSHVSAQPPNSPKSNTVTRFIIDNPGTKSITVELSRATCAFSAEMPLRAIRTPQGGVDTFGDLPPDVFAAGVNIEVQIGSTGMVTGRILASN